MIEEGSADPYFQDRWANTALDEARRVGAGPVVEYLKVRDGNDWKGVAWRKRSEPLLMDMMLQGGEVIFVMYTPWPG